MLGRPIQLVMFVLLGMLCSGCSLLSSTTSTSSMSPSATSASLPSTPVASTQHTPIVLGRVNDPTATRRATTQPRATARRLTATPRTTPRARATAVPLPDTPPAAGPIAGFQTVTPDELPREARQTLALIVKGGPFPYRQDGVVFQNRERRLPRQSNGYYHEYTVVTPGEGDRGARRIITGSNGEYFYTDDHYNSFVQVLTS